MVTDEGGVAQPTRAPIYLTETWSGLVLRNTHVMGDEGEKMAVLK